MNKLEALFEDFVNCEQGAIADPWPIFDQIRAADQPVFYSGALGAWIVTRRKDVLAVLRDTDTWSTRSVGSGKVGIAQFLGHLQTLSADPEMAAATKEFVNVRKGGEVLLTADPPEHRQQRRALDRIFRYHRIQQLESEVKEISADLIAKFSRRGHADLVSEYAVMLPITILARAFGVPEEDRSKVKRWSKELGVRLGRANLDLDAVRKLILSEREFRHYFSVLLEQRASEPGDDLISDIATAEVDGQVLAHAVRLEALQQFVIAGHETTAANIANIGHKLAANSEIRDRLAANRSLVPGFVEEMLRHQTPFLGFFRVAKYDTEMDGVKIGAGEHVWISYAAANYDPDGCPVPHTFDLTREPNPHLSFGRGEHNCLGAPLARLESVIATNALLDLPNLTLAEDYVANYAPSYLLRTLTSLQVTFDGYD